jgi:hypothetical protein
MGKHQDLGGGVVEAAIRSREAARGSGPGNATPEILMLPSLAKLPAMAAIAVTQRRRDERDRIGDVAALGLRGSGSVGGMHPGGPGGSLTVRSASRPQVVWYGNVDGSATLMRVVNAGEFFPIPGQFWTPIDSNGFDEASICCYRSGVRSTMTHSARDLAASLNQPHSGPQLAKAA